MSFPVRTSWKNIRDKTFESLNNYFNLANIKISEIIGLVLKQGSRWIWDKILKMEINVTYLCAEIIGNIGKYIKIDTNC